MDQRIAALIESALDSNVSLDSLVADLEYAIKHKTSQAPFAQAALAAVRSAASA